MNLVKRTVSGGQQRCAGHEAGSQECCLDKWVIYEQFNVVKVIGGGREGALAGKDS